tara:strand:+ start:482 stop:2527 length:2046 start_codon:yes stop_codon:yes gene_type:complete
MATPLINPLRIQGGTFYSFSSAVRDIQKTFSDDDARFVFSKFALLDIPDVATPSGNYENYVVWEGIGAFAGSGTSSVPNVSIDNNSNIAESFQNYALNFEEEILLGTNNLAQLYDNTQLYTASERVFWKWMAQINSVRFRSATTAESNITNHFTEEDSSSTYKRVVKYMGDIDIINNVSRGGYDYSEVYIHVPTTHGSTPLVMWKPYVDTNYAPGRSWNNGETYIVGRDGSSTHPSGLDLRAFYDNDISTSYTTQSTFGNITNWVGTAAISAGTPKPVKLSNADGIILDWNPISYKPITDDPNITIIPEFNSTDAAGDFSFNAVLVYYDTYKNSTPDEKATNLYGVLFLDDYVNQGAGNAFLKRFDKFKPNKITKLNGNGYSFKLDIKFDSTISNLGVETIINDYNTFSMDLFTDASIRLQEAADMFIDSEIDIINMKTRLTSLENFYFTQESLNNLSSRLSQLEVSLNNAKLSFQSSTTIMDLISRLSNNLNQVINGELSSELSFNTEVVQGGRGILIDKSVPNKIIVTNKVQQYNTFTECGNDSKNIITDLGNGKTPTNTTNGNILFLGEYTNYFKQKNQNSDPTTGIETFSDNVYINIDDLSNNWMKGQVLRFVFDDYIDLSGNTITFMTDKNNKFKQGVFGKKIGTVTTSMTFSNKPIIEITCTDASLYTFNIDIIR